jgi:integrase
LLAVSRRYALDRGAKKVPKTTLTDMTVRALRPGTYFDAKTPAFGIRVGKHRRTWIVMRGRDRIRTIVGHYPDMSLSDARTEAKKLLSEKPDLKRPNLTFEKARDLFLEDNYADAKPRTKKEAERLLKKHFATLSEKRLAEITDADIHKELTPLARSEALHSFRVARTLFRWCVRPPRRYIAHSPLEGYPAPSQDGQRARILSDDELKAVWNAATGMFGAMVRLLVLWGTRKGETAVLRREWIADGLLTIPGAHTKNGRAHVIPIQPLAKELLEARPERGPYFFPGRWDADTHFHEGSWTKLHKDLMENSGTSDWTIHDLRRTFRSLLSRLKVPREVAEVLMNHKRGILEDIYDRYAYLDEKREALAKVEAHVSRLLKQNTEGDGQRPHAASAPQA